MGNSLAAAAPVSSPPSLPQRCSPGRMQLEEPKTTGTRESVNHRRPHMHHSPEEGECLNRGVWGVLQSWARGCLSADPDGEELG